MTRPGWPDLPALLAEIADVAGIDAALAIAAAKGGQEVFIVARLTPDNWLVKVIGREKAAALSAHFCSGRSRQKLVIPLGPSGSYMAERRRRAKLMAEAQARGASANEIASAAGVTTRSVWRFRASLREEDDGQESLF